MVPGVSRRYLAVALVAVVLVGGYAAFGYTPGPAEQPDTPYRVDDPFALAQDTGASSFVVTEAFYTGRGTTADTTFYRVRYTYNGSAVRLQIAWDNASIRTDVYLTPDREYTRVEYENESEFQERLERMAGEDIVSVNESAQLFYTAENRSGPYAQDWEISLLNASLLSAAPVERVGTTTYRDEEATVYAPTTGWTRVDGPNNSQPIYVTAASGRILVDPETGVPYRINTTFTWKRAGSWGETLFRESYTSRHRYQMNLDTSPGNVSPEWVDRVRNTTQAGG